jgi:hypothetical protein
MGRSEYKRHNDTMRNAHYILVIKPQKKKQVGKLKNIMEDTECPIYSVSEHSSFNTYKACIFWNIPAKLRDTIGGIIHIKKKLS